MKKESDMRGVLADKILFYKHTAEFIGSSKYYRLLRKIPIINKSFACILNIPTEINQDIRELRRNERHTLSLLRNIQQSPIYLVWQLMNKAKNLIINNTTKEITVNNEAWPKHLPLVSVIIPCFNYGTYLEETIKSVKTQTLRNIEIIVVDDGSDDKKTQSLLATLPRKCQIKTLHQANKGLPSARNLGIKQAKGKYICCLDSDDLLKPTYLYSCVKEMEMNNLDVCYSDLKEFGDSNKRRNAGDFNVERLIYSNSSLVAAVFKKKTWEKVGGYDENMIYGYEDWEFWIRVAKSGGIGKRIPKALFLYRKHGKTMIDETKKKHKEIFDYIKSKNSDIYTNSFALPHAIKKQSIEYKVINGDINLK